MNLEFKRPSVKDETTFVGSSLTSRSLQECRQHGLNSNRNAPGSLADLSDEQLAEHAKKEGQDAKALFGL